MRIIHGPNATNVLHLGYCAALRRTRGCQHDECPYAWAIWLDCVLPVGASEMNALTRGLFGWIASYPWGQRDECPYPWALRLDCVLPVGASATHKVDLSYTRRAVWRHCVLPVGAGEGRSLTRGGVAGESLTRGGRSRGKPYPWRPGQGKALPVGAGAGGSFTRGGRGRRKPYPWWSEQGQVLLVEAGAGKSLYPWRLARRMSLQIV